MKNELLPSPYELIFGCDALSDTEKIVLYQIHKLSLYDTCVGWIINYLTLSTTTGKGINDLKAILAELYRKEYLSMSEDTLEEDCEIEIRFSKLLYEREEGRVCFPAI